MKPSYTLKELKVPLIDLQTCRDHYQKANSRGIKPIISEAMICSKLPVERMDQYIVRTHPIGTFQSPPLSQCASRECLHGMPHRECLPRNASMECLTSSASLGESSSVWTGPNSIDLSYTTGRISSPFALCVA